MADVNVIALLIAMVVLLIWDWRKMLFSCILLGLDTCGTQRHWGSLDGVASVDYELCMIVFHPLKYCILALLWGATAGAEEVMATDHMMITRAINHLSRRNIVDISAGLACRGIKRIPLLALPLREVCLLLESSLTSFMLVRWES